MTGGSGTLIPIRGVHKSQPVPVDSWGCCENKDPETERLRVTIDATSSVSALLRVPAGAVAGYVFAHGAGAGMAKVFTNKWSADLNTG